MLQNFVKEKSREKQNIYLHTKKKKEKLGFIYIDIFFFLFPALILFPYLILNKIETQKKILSYHKIEKIFSRNTKLSI